MKASTLATILSALFIITSFNSYSQLAAKVAESNFKNFDANKSGWLSGKELIACECNQFDTNGDNEVTLEEFLTGKGITRKITENTTIAKPSSVTPPTTKTTETRVQSAGSFAVGNKVEAYEIGTWYKAAIKAVGTGDKQGQYLVDYDDYSTDRWFYAKDLRPIKIEKTFSTNGGPRQGKYTVLSYGANTNPLRLGHFQLSAGGKYSFHDNGGGLTGSGTYKYDDAKEVKWLSGPFSNYKWGGAFKIEREGKTHTIKLSRSTFGTNSTDNQ